jgi:predicted Zn finger-like uncharacterized protein
MYSQCPECLTRFRVMAAALRSAHGTVRCGRCGSAFDALLRLTDTLPDEPGVSSSVEMPPVDALASAHRDRDTVGDDAVVTEFHFSADDVEQVFIDARDWQRQFGEGEAAGSVAPPSANGARGKPVLTLAAGANGAAAPGRDAPELDVHEPEAVEDITLEGERIVIEGQPDLDDDLREIGSGDLPYDGPDDAVRLDGSVDSSAAPIDLDATGPFETLPHVPESKYPVLGDDRPHARAEFIDTVAAAAATKARVHDVPAAAEAAAASAGPAVNPPAAIRPYRLREQSATLDEPFEGFGDDKDEDATGRRSALLWGFGAVVLALVLLAQLTHHFRQELARDATLGPLLRPIYAQLGRPLPPNWDLAAFELRQWGANEGAATAGVMTVRASLRNRADFAQPMPLLRLELEDRFGGTVARRDFLPAEYLKDPAQASRLLASGAQTEAELALVDVAPDAVGYRLDVCLPETRGVRCTQSSAERGVPQ